jgi:RNA polymerase sigma-70 factor (ECF subfamily)
MSDRTAIDRPERQQPTMTADGGVTDADARLMVGFQRGEPRCFDQLFHRYKAAVVNFAYRFTGRRDLAEELAQDIFIKCYRAAQSYRPEARFSTWLFRIARNHCLNELRRPEHRMGVQSLHDGAQQRCSAPTPEAQAAAHDLQRRLSALLAALPERQRTALILSRFHQMSYDEIAQTMQTSVSAVKSLLNRAKDQLVAALRGDGVSHEM